tara:strand:- start:2287 stop:2706 length:420 start_codon:yes stop_codon:yes gene_type:complete
VSEITERTYNDPDFEKKWNGVFGEPLYLWDLETKRKLLFLATLARWNPDVAPLYQDQLILIVGLDIGGYGPNTLRALKAAINRRLRITFKALGNGADRLYAFEHETQREDVSLMLEEVRNKQIFEHLRNELRNYRRGAL